MASKLANAAYEWLKEHSRGGEVSTDALWAGMQKALPGLTAVTKKRKTPRTTLMRDLRKDKEARFVIGNRRVRLRQID